MDEKLIDFSFTDIQLLSKTVNYVNVGQEFGFRYEINVDSKVRAEIKTVVVLVNVSIKNEKDALLVNIAVVFSFEVKEFEKYIILKDSGLYEVPDVLDEIFRQVSISTTRGIIYSELRGTYLHSAIMPVVFPKQAIKEKDVAVLETLKKTEQKD